MNERKINEMMFALIEHEPCNEAVIANINYPHLGNTGRDITVFKRRL